MKNLDYLAAKYSQQMINSLRGNQDIKSSDVDNVVTKTLGVLTEDGVFAAFIFMKAHKEKERAIADALVKALLDLTHEVYEDLNRSQNNTRSILAFISEKITKDLPRLMLCKSIYERTLIYARYSAKAWSKEE